MTILTGDSLVILPTLPADSIESCVSDPPYGLEFMSVAWDTFGDGRKGGERVPNTWGDHGSKEHPRNAMQAAHVRRKKSVAFEEFSYAWACEVLRVLKPGGYLLAFGGTRTYHRLTCAIEDAGFEVRDCLMWLYGSGFPKGKGCLKPGWEPIVLARKPAPWLNIDGCRIENAGADTTSRPNSVGKRYDEGEHVYGRGIGYGVPMLNPAGRWPANVVLDEEAAAQLDLQAGIRTSGSYSGFRNSDKSRNAFGHYGGHGPRFENAGHEGSAGGASRFFYCAKASPSERGAFNDHPTVKPLALMRWLVRLVTPAGGTVLDPFCGSGSTLIAAHREGFEAIGIDSDPHAIEITRRRQADEAGPLFAEDVS